MRSRVLKAHGLCRQRNNEFNIVSGNLKKRKKRSIHVFIDPTSFHYHKYNLISSNNFSDIIYLSTHNYIKTSLKHSLARVGTPPPKKKLKHYFFEIEIQIFYLLTLSPLLSNLFNYMRERFSCPWALFKLLFRLSGSD